MRPATQILMERLLEAFSRSIYLDKELATELGVSKRRVRYVLRCIFQKYGLDGKVDLAFRHNVISDQLRRSRSTPKLRP